jgi:MGT family glycosyltransferase
MGNLVFLCQPAFGHLNPLLTIALQARADGHQVRFILPGLQPSPGMAAVLQNSSLLQTAADIPRRLAAQGIEVELVPPPLSQLGLTIALPLSATSGYTETVLASLLFASGMMHYSQAIQRRLSTAPPHALVTDFAFLQAALAADALNIPYVAVYHSGLPFRGPLVPPFGSGLPIGETDSPRARRAAARERLLLKTFDGAVNRARHRLGLAPMAPEMMRRPYSPWLNLILSDPAIEAPRDLGDAPVEFVGPCFAGRPPSGDPSFSLDLLKHDRRRVYVSLGTVFNNRPELFQTLMSALNQPDLQVIVSAGGAYETLRRSPIPANVSLFRSVPQTQLLPHLDVFVSHGGNNSTNEALAAGVPLLVLPIGGEQADNASRVVYLGAGLRADVRDLTPTTVSTQVRRLLTEPSFRQRARQCADQLAQTDSPRAASAAITNMLGRTAARTDTTASTIAI